MSLFRVEGATPDENDESKEHSLAARLAAVRATAEEAQTTVDESAAQYQTLIREQVDFHANYVPAFDNDPAFAAAPAPAPGLPAAPAARPILSARREFCRSLAAPSRFGAIRAHSCCARQVTSSCSPRARTA